MSTRAVGGNLRSFNLSRMSRGHISPTRSTENGQLPIAAAPRSSMVAIKAQILLLSAFQELV